MILRLLLRRFLFGEEIPKPAYEYARRISEITGLPLEEVLKSQPVKNLVKRWRETVYVKI
jgi:hypothetical protein